MPNMTRLNGSDLNYFKGIVSQALSGDFGPVDEVLIEHDGGRVRFSVNDTTSQWIGEGHGETSSAPTSSNGENAKPLKNRDRIELLEHDVQWLKGIVAKAESRLGVSLR